MRSEATAHAIFDIFIEDETEALLMVDTSNALNSPEKHFFTIKKPYVLSSYNYVH